MNIPYRSPLEWEDGMCGLFALPEELYRPAKGINQSTLKTVLRSPAHAKWGMDNPKEATPAMTLGSLTHLACLEPGLYGQGTSHYVKPEGLSFASKEGKAWKAERGDLPIISEEDDGKLRGMQAAVVQHPIASYIIGNGANEIAGFSVDEETGELLKMKADKVFTDREGNVWLADLKTTDDAREFNRTALNFSYDMQAAFYTDIARATGLDVKGFLFIAVERDAPHGIMVYELDAELMQFGRSRYREALNRFHLCKTSGIWPNYETTVLTLSIPPWAKKP